MLEQPPGELAGLGEQAPDSLLAGCRLHGVIKPRRDPLPGCFGRAEQPVDVPVRLKIDIGDGAVILVRGHEDQAAVAGFPVRPLSGPRLRGPGPMALPLGDLPWIEQVELDSAGDVGNAGLARLAGGEVAGFLGFPRASAVGAAADGEAGDEDLEQECGEGEFLLVRGEKPRRCPSRRPGRAGS
jgi:hypothetical protein